MKRKPIHYLTIGIVVSALLFTFKMYNDFKEKKLSDIIIYNSSNFNSLEFQYHSNSYWKTDQKEQVEELLDFLSLYQVKKMNDAEWDSDVSQQKVLQISILSKSKPTMALILEDRISTYSGYYKVVDGLIDMDWIEKYNEKYQN